MPQMSSSDRILMAAQDMTDALKHPHPYFPFATIRYDTITALATLSVNGWVYMEIRKGMYGLKQAGLLASQLLQKRLKPFG
jgi:hypothetical protein